MCPRFKTEMKKFREIANPEDFEFDSDQNGTQFKPEVIEIKVEDESTEEPPKKKKKQPQPKLISLHF